MTRDHAHHPWGQSDAWVEGAPRQRRLARVGQCICIDAPEHEVRAAHPEWAMDDWRNALIHPSRPRRLVLFSVVASRVSVRSACTFTWHTKMLPRRSDQKRMRREARLLQELDHQTHCGTHRVVSTILNRNDPTGSGSSLFGRCDMSPASMIAALQVSRPDVRRARYSQVEVPAFMVCRK